jgi:S1-C subfamily serine protease
MKKLLLLLFLIPNLVFAEAWDINPANYESCMDETVGPINLSNSRETCNDCSDRWPLWINHPECFIEITLRDGQTKYIGTINYINPEEVRSRTEPDMLANGVGKLIFRDGSVLHSRWENGRSVNPRMYVTQDNEYRNDEIKGEVIVSIFSHKYESNNSGVWKVDAFFDHPLPSIPATKKLADGSNGTPKVSDSGGGFDPKNEQESSKPDVNERKDPPKTYTTQNDNELLPAASGSGFAISKNGHILTNNHVINGCQALNIHTNGKLMPARIIASDPKNDLALIKGTFKPQTVFYLNPSSPRLLDDIYVAGYPFGYAISSSIKMTTGIISSLSGIGNNFSNMQIDAAIQPGNSGGPVVDKKGNVVGVAVAKLNMQAVFEDFGVIPENTNFAIKSSTARSFAESNNISLIKKSAYKGKNLGSYIENGTYYLSCMMTMAKIKEMTTQKVFFKNITK